MHQLIASSIDHCCEMANHAVASTYGGQHMMDSSSYKSSGGQSKSGRQSESARMLADSPYATGVAFPSGSPWPTFSTIISVARYLCSLFSKIYTS